jgi:hypothetical protein
MRLNIQGAARGRPLPPRERRSGTHLKGSWGCPGRGTAGPERNLCADEVVPYLQEGDPFDRGRIRSERRHGCVLALQAYGSTRIRPPVSDHHDALGVELPPPE